ncbi:hypothetical protein BH24BAC1_BH24BAC1_36270 [soil metagenome]
MMTIILRTDPSHAYPDFWKVILSGQLVFNDCLGQEICRQMENCSPFMKTFLPLLCFLPWLLFSSEVLGQYYPYP